MVIAADGSEPFPVRRELCGAVLFESVSRQIVSHVRNCTVWVVQQYALRHLRIRFHS